MRIGISEIYKDYLSELKSRKTYLLADKNSYESSKNYLLDRIKDNEHYIKNFTNIDYSEIKNLDRIISENSLRHLVSLIGIDIISIRRTLNMIVEINKSLNKINKDLKSIEDSIIDNEVFSRILEKFNTKISDEIVYKGYFFNLGYNLGSIRIKKINAQFNRDGSIRTKKRIDWPNSNIKKKEILARGGIPFKVLTRDESRNILTHNNGEMWYVYYNNLFDYLWYWNKGNCKILNSPYYRFRPTIYNNTSKGGKLGNINKLKQLVTSESELLKNFYV